jgi:hypothetical protein
MARIGSVPAAPFVGDQFVSLYLGSTRVPTVPGKPVIISAEYQEEPPRTFIYCQMPLADGGLPIEPDVRLDGDYQPYDEWDATTGEVVLDSSEESTVGKEVRVRFYNALGGGASSAPFIVTS